MNMAMLKKIFKHYNTNMQLYSWISIVSTKQNSKKNNRDQTKIINKVKERSELLNEALTWLGEVVYDLLRDDKIRNDKNLRFKFK